VINAEKEKEVTKQSVVGRNLLSTRQSGPTSLPVMSGTSLSEGPSASVAPGMKPVSQGTVDHLLHGKINDLSKTMMTVIECMFEMKAERTLPEVKQVITEEDSSRRDRESKKLIEDTFKAMKIDLMKDMSMLLESSSAMNQRTSLASQNSLQSNLQSTIQSNLQANSVQQINSMTSAVTKAGQSSNTIIQGNLL
jgi:hypothetical protein